MKDRLIELIGKARTAMWGKEIPNIAAKDRFIADHLLANGVIVPPVNTGNTIYSISTDKLNELKVESISATIPSCWR